MIPLLSFKPRELSRCSVLPDLVTDWWVLKGHKVRDPEEISHVALCTVQMFLMRKDVKSRMYSFHILIKCVELFHSPSIIHHPKSYLLAPPGGQPIHRGHSWSVPDMWCLVGFDALEMLTDSLDPFSWNTRMKVQIYCKQWHHIDFFFYPLFFFYISFFF